MKLSKYFIIFIFIVVLLIPYFSFSATYRVVSYNTLNFNFSSMPSSGHDLERILAFRDILDSIDADIVVVQEMINSASATFFRDSVLNNTTSGEYSMAPFIAHPSDTNSALYYKSDVTYIGYNYYYDPDNSPRYMMEYTLSIEGQEFKVYSLHLKASTGSDNETRRRLDAELLRRTVLNELPQNYHFFLCGDFNIYSSSDSAYQEFLADQSLTPSGENNNGQSQDFVGTIWTPISIPHYITQSTRTSDLGDGGATGGLDDRFDLILCSYALTNSTALEYIPSSYTVYGNDGNHYNKAITDSPVYDPLGIADATDLLNASDHLPVYVEFENVPAVDDYFLY